MASPEIDPSGNDVADAAESIGVETGGAITELLRRASSGDAAAEAALAEAVYDRMQRVARAQLAQERRPREGDPTLDATALVNETLMKLLQAPRDYANRRHFYGFASKVMLRVLQDDRRRRRRLRRGGHLVKMTISQLRRAGEEPGTGPAMDLEELPPILDELRSLHPRKAEVVELRVFFGLEMPEIARVVGVSLPTVERDWHFSKHWLAARLAP